MKGRRLVIGLLYLAAGALQALVLTRVLLQVLGALAGEPLPGVIYPMTAPLVAPFSSLRPIWQSRERFLETGSVLALLVIFVVAYIGARLLRVHVGRLETGD